MSLYHRLPDHHEEDAELLWDQLNDEQSREVQQHQSRFHRPSATSRTNHLVILQSMVWNTLGRTASATSSAWRAARDAWRSHPSSQQRRSTDVDWDEQFGMDELLRPQSYTTTTTTTDTTATSRNTTANGKPNPGYPFVVLRTNQHFPSRRGLSREQDHWGLAANMDVFLQHLYHYYYHRGLQPMICQFVVEFASLVFTLWLSRILLYRVDWHKLVQITCQKDETCTTHWSEYYYQQHPSTTWWFLVQGYTLLLVAYAGFSVWNFWQSLGHAWKCQVILHDKLGISRRKLQGGAVSWDAVVQALVQAQSSGEYRTALSQLDALVVAQRILRKDNFLLAFWNQGLLDVKIGNRQYWCPTLEWSLHFAVLNFMFNHKYEVRPAFCLDATSLERRLVVCGIVHAVLLPFLILFVSLHFLFRNVYDFKTSKSLGNKHWSTVAVWTFREYNELPHVLERRLEPSYAASEAYLKLFGQSEVMAALGKLLVFLGGAVGGVLLVLGVLNDDILLHVQLWNRNLLWYAGMAGIAYSVGKSLLPTKEAQPSVTRNLFADMDAALKQVAGHTHYYPEHWKGRGWDTKVHEQFGMLFDSKVKLFLWELVSLVLAPYILIGKLSKCAPAICEFCMTIKAKVPGAGDVCGYSAFDFDTFKDEAWDGKTLGDSAVLVEDDDDDDEHQAQTRRPQHNHESLVESILRTGNLEEATRQHPKPKAKDGKMEKSFFGFQAAHPSWKCSPSGQSLVDRVEEYKQAELAAISRERDLYIEAAARQLETLAHLETFQKSSSRDPKVRFEKYRLREAHHGPADADAGTHPSPRLEALSSPHHQPPLSSAAPSSAPNLPPATTTTAGTTTSTPPLPAVQQQHNAATTLRPPPLLAPATVASSGFPFARDVDEADQGSSALTALSQPAEGRPQHFSVPSSLQQQNHDHGQFHSISSIGPPRSTTLVDPLAAASLAPPLGASFSDRDVLRAGLSTELRRLLTLSTTLESSTTSLLQQQQQHHDDGSTSLLVPTSMSMADPSSITTAEQRQYYWLERFHQHLESQQQQQQQQLQRGEEVPEENAPRIAQSSLPTSFATMPAPPGAAAGSSSASLDRRGGEPNGGDNGFSSASNIV